MLSIQIFTQSQKTSGTIKLTFKLRDGRKADLRFKSDLVADVEQLAKLENDGSPKSRYKIYDKILSANIKNEIALIEDAYMKMNEDGLDITSAVLTSLVQEAKNQVVEKRNSEPSLLERFQSYINEAVKLEFIQNKRELRYKSIHGCLSRFLTIKGKSQITADELTSDDVLAFKSFLADEYLYVNRNKRLYAGLPSLSIPKKKRADNTVAVMLKALKAAYATFDCKSPFDAMPKKYKAAILREQYIEPICLNRDEFFKLMKSSVPEKLQETKDAFLLQCAFGCRVADFASLTMNSISVNEDGIPYIHYIPQKTIRTNIQLTETKTPIMLYALDIIKKYEFKFPILKYVSGKSGYNVKIKEVFQYCGFDRKVREINPETNKIDTFPLYEVASSKLCRKTHVNIMNEIQIDKYAAGLHSAGSNAVDRYINNTISQHFLMMCATFNQPFYKVDEELNVI